MYLLLQLLYLYSKLFFRIKSYKTKKKARNFMETTLIDLRNLWMKRLQYFSCVQCSCDKKCDLHQIEACKNYNCIHLLNLDECLTNNVITLVIRIK